MRPFKFTDPKTQDAAITAAVANPNARFLAGGTNLLDLMKEDVERPDELIDISGLTLTGITKIFSVDGGTAVSIGGMAKNTDTANHPLIRKEFPLLTQAILAGASAQIRNMASNGGNLLQRTRCPYFYDIAMPCNKRVPGSGCGAKEGFSRMHAIFGWSEKCVAVHPSDMCVALAALDAIVHVTGANGKKRSIAFTDFHRLPGDTPEQDNNLGMGELITSIEIPANHFAAKSYYLKIRDRASYAFALVSVAAAVETNGNTIIKTNIALGGVAHKPWRALEAESFLAGKQASEENFKKAAALAMEAAKPLAHNKFKIAMCTLAISHALNKAMKGSNV
ncbi:MAG: xanthine dehydrogenase family protein subunit M [Bacteroidota bacterium]